MIKNEKKKKEYFKQYYLEKIKPSRKKKIMVEVPLLFTMKVWKNKSNQQKLVTIPKYSGINEGDYVIVKTKDKMEQSKRLIFQTLKILLEENTEKDKKERKKLLMRIDVELNPKEENQNEKRKHAQN